MSLNLIATAEDLRRIAGRRAQIGTSEVAQRALLIVRLTQWVAELWHDTEQVRARRRMLREQFGAERYASARLAGPPSRRAHDDGPVAGVRGHRSGNKQTSWHDRVVEVAVVHLDGQGRVEREVAGVTTDQAHSALHDARAAAQLLTHFINMAGQPPPWATQLAAAAKQAWPTVQPTNAHPVQRRRPGHQPEHFLSRLTARLPRVNDPRGDAYLEALDRALLDRHISTVEPDTLVAAAERLNLGRYDVMALHEKYLHALAAAALSPWAHRPGARAGRRSAACSIASWTSGLRCS
jgi:hypothetical protein